MPLEIATYISDLVQSNPAASDPLAGADDHLRLIKATLKNTLAHTGQLTNTDNQLIPAGGTFTKPAYSFAAEPTLGIQRSAAGTMSVVGGKLKGTREVGEVVMFLKEPASLGRTTADTGKDWLELNGASYNVSDYPALATFLGVASGTFTLDDMYTTGRFPRSRTSTVAARTAQANTGGPHVHPDVTATTAAETQEHTHSFSGTTGSMNQNASHAHTYSAVMNAGGGGVGGGGAFGPQQSGLSTSATNTDHQHTFSGTTSGRSSSHNHTVTVSTPANSGTTETRPEAIAFVFAVKT
ncbi:phage tail protein [Bradyrhizobium sp. B117]|uniref:phage tail protein n=1 Tax=Bradyrhizobium sp. B117 TaxID=3140246 RepID=UPI003184528E